MTPIQSKNKTLTKLMPVALAVTVLTGLSMPVMAFDFTDTQNHWAKYDIDTLTTKGVLSWYSNGQFRPEQTMSRYEFANTVKRAIYLMPEDLKNMQTLQVLEDSTENNKPVLRAEVLAVLAEVIRDSNLVDHTYQSRTEVTRNLNEFEDAGKVPMSLKDEVSLAIEHNLIDNNPSAKNMIEPLNTATRAEIASMLNNLILHQEVAYANEHMHANHTFNATLSTPLYTKFNKVGDRVSAIVQRPTITPQGYFLPAGTKLSGEVTTIVPAEANQMGHMALEFDEAVTPYGDRYDIDAEIAVENDLTPMNFVEVVQTVPDRSFDALKAQIKTLMGSRVGTAQGKLNVYEDPTVVVRTDRILYNVDRNDVLVGVGDVIRLRFDGQ